MSGRLRTQMWFEFRDFGRALPLLSAVVLLLAAVETLLSGWLVVSAGRTESGGFLRWTVQLWAGVVVAGALGVGWTRWFSRGLPQLVASAPVSNMDLTWAKLLAAACSTLAAFLCTLPFALWAGLQAAGAMTFSAKREVLMRAFEGGEGVSWIAIYLPLMVVVAWGQLLLSLLLSLNPRVGERFDVLAACAALALGCVWLADVRRWPHAASVAFTCGISLSLLLKGGTAAWLLRQLWVAGRAERKYALQALAGWLATVAGLAAIGIAATSTENSPAHWTLLSVALVVPLNRVLAMPYGIARVRHR